MRILARVLLGLGVFLLVAGVLAVAWAPGVVKKTPLDVDTTTIYEGEAAKIDTATGDFDKKPVFAITHTKADSKKSSDDHVLFVETGFAVFDAGGARECVNGNDPDLNSQPRHLRDRPHDRARGSRTSTTRPTRAPPRV